MVIKFTLTMIKVRVNIQGKEKDFDKVELSWTSEITIEKYLQISTLWLKRRNLLLETMDGLRRVGSSSLTLEPLDKEIKSLK